MTTINFEFRGLTDALVGAVGDEQRAIRSAGRRTMTRVMNSAKAMAVTEIRRVYNVPARVLRDRIVVYPPRLDDGGLSGALEFGGRSVSLSYFGARQQAGSRVITRTRVSNSRRQSPRFQGVSVQVLTTRTTLLRHAFMQRFRSGHVGVLRRVGSERYPIEVKSAVSIASMFERAEITEAIRRKIEADLERVFEHELAYAQGRL